MKLILNLEVDLVKMRTEILERIATHFDLTLGGRIVAKILDRASERAANIQRAGSKPPWTPSKPSTTAYCRRSRSSVANDRSTLSGLRALEREAS